MLRYSIDILRDLVKFDTTSRNSNICLIEYVETLLARSGVIFERVSNADGSKANLIVRIGPDVPGGPLLSGHTDVVPVDGQNWSSDPFILDERDGRFYGRGTCDMKGFIACVLAKVPDWASMALQKPIYIVLSYDEEIGCLGVPSALAVLQKRGIAPDICIIGEPTDLDVAIGHKSRADIDVICTAKGGHAAAIEFPTVTSALDLAADFHARLRNARGDIGRLLGDEISLGPATLAVTTGFEAARTRNVVPAHTAFHYDFRGAIGIEAERILNVLRPYADESITGFQGEGKTETLKIDIAANVSGVGFRCLDPGTVALAQKLAVRDRTTVIHFSTEAPRFEEVGLGHKTIICGPGEIGQMHQPDESISVRDLRRCLSMMNRVTAYVMQPG